MDLLLIFAVLIAFFSVLTLTPWLIKFFTQIGLIVKDQHKEKKPLIPVSGGVVVFLGIYLGVMFVLFIQTFYFHSSFRLVTMLAFIASISAITFVGLFDDLLIRKDHESSFGLKQWQKPLLTVFAAVPLMAVNLGDSSMWLPFFSTVDFGVFYTFVLIPLGVVGASNMVNLLGGFNGLEAGLGFVYIGNLSLYAYSVGSYDAMLIGAITCAALLAFLVYNWTPAKMFPGDSLTYLLGGILVSMAIIGNIEKAALIVSIPFFIEFVLKLRGKLKNQSYGYSENGKVKSFYDKIYSIPHFFTRSGKFTEKQVVFFVIFIELIFCSLVWII